MTTRRLASVPASPVQDEEHQAERRRSIREAVERLRPGQPLLGELVAETILLSEAAGLAPGPKRKGPRKKKPLSAEEQAKADEELVAPVLVSLEEAARRMGVKEGLLRKMIYKPLRKGGVIALKMGRRNLVPVSEFTDWITREKARQLGVIDG